MKKSTKILFKISSILSYITAIFFAILALLLLFEEENTTEMFTNVYLFLDKTATSSDVSNMIFSYVLFIGFSAYSSFSAGRLYNFLSKARDNHIFQNLGTLGFVAGFQIVFGLFLCPPLTLVAPILALIAYAQCKNLEKHKIKIDLPAVIISEKQQAITIHPQALQTMVAKINELKINRAKGLYTEDQYNEKLSKILGGDFS